MNPTKTPPQTEEKKTQFQGLIEAKVGEIMEGIDFEDFRSIKKRQKIIEDFAVYASRIRPSEYVVNLIMNEVRRLCGDDWIIYKGSLNIKAL